MPDAAIQLLQQRTAQLAAVREIGRVVAEVQDLNTALDWITRQTTEIMGVDSCSIYLYDAEQDLLTLAASTGLRPDAIGHVQLRRGAGLTGWAVEHGQLVAVADVMADSRFTRNVGSGESRFTSMMVVPLQARGKTVGAANVQTQAKHEFSAYEIELFGFITDLAATALERVKLVHAAVVQEIHHRVKNNLQTIAMLLRLQIAQADCLTPEDVLHETINRVLSIATVHEILAHERQDTVDLLLLVKQVTRGFVRGMTLGNQVQLEIDGETILIPAPVATNLALVTNELLQNALEHGLAHRNVGKVWIKLRQTAEILELTLEDDGTGLPPEFDFDQHQGLGLQLIQTIVTEDLMGTFALEPSPGGGTCASIRVPLDVVKDEKLYA